jgi:hypothetical protein
MVGFFLLDVARIDALLQFILAVAGQQDELRDRELGPIHFLKYAYLADLAYADVNNGDTFTGAPWQFYDFGPWSPAVLHRVEPAVAAAEGERKIIRGVRYGDFVRYTLQDDELLDRLDRKLPSSAASAVRWAMRQFGSDTPSLLRYVYMTRPMLRAAPGEMLSFDIGEKEPEPVLEPAPVSDQDADRAAKQRRKIADQLRKRVRTRLAERSRAGEGTPANPAPRYDDVFFDGQAWLDQQAGDAVPLTEGELAFSPDIWKSRGRGESGGDASS